MKQKAKQNGVFSVNCRILEWTESVISSLFPIPVQATLIDNFRVINLRKGHFFWSAIGDLTYFPPDYLIVCATSWFVLLQKNDLEKKLKARNMSSPRTPYKICTKSLTLAQTIGRKPSHLLCFEMLSLYNRPSLGINIMHQNWRDLAPNSTL